MTGTVYSIGHGTASAEDFTRTLADAGIRSLAAAGIEYVHLAGLGGRHAPRADSPHTGLRVAAFRGYADHMATDEFRDDCARLEALARRMPTAFMCAETFWWKCHRRLLADRMVADGWTVMHLRVGGPAEPHRLTDAARVEQGRLSYD
jgi:uncharacterized protein (DUF488 family)